MIHWAIPENIHTPPMDDIGNPVGNAQWAWLEIHKFLQNFVNFNRNSRKTIQIFAKFRNSSRFWMSRLWNPAKAVVLLGNSEIFRYPIQCRPWRGGGGGGDGIFSGMAHFRGQAWYSWYCCLLNLNFNSQQLNVNPTDSKEEPVTKAKRCEFQSSQSKFWTSLQWLTT